MRPITLLAKRELLEYWRDGRLLWAGGIVLILLLTALVLGWQQERRAGTERLSAQQASYRNWLDQQAKNPHAAAHYGAYVFKPIPRLALIDPGLDPYLGTTVYLEAHVQNEFKFRPADDSTGLQRFGGLSAAWVLQFLVPLLIIALGFNAFAGERDQGTLRQLLSCGAAASSLLWGKALAMAASVALLLFPAAVVMLAVIGSGASATESGDDLARLLAMGIGYATYFAIYIFLTLAISAMASSARTTLLILLGVWIVNSMVFPRVVADLARQMVPLTSIGELENVIERDRRKAINRMLKEEFQVDLLKELPDSAAGKSLEINDQISIPVLERHFGELWDSLEQHHSAQVWSGLLAPLLAVRSLSMGMAGTDFAQHRDFAEAAEQYRRLISRIMNRDIIEDAGGRGYHYLADPALWKKVPPFEYHPPSFGWLLQRNVQSFAILLVVLGGTLVLARRSMRHLRGTTESKPRRVNGSVRSVRLTRAYPGAGSKTGLIFWQEWRLLTAEKTLRMIVALSLVLVGYGLHNGIERIEQREASLSAVQEQHEARLQSLLARLPKILAGEEEPDFILNPADPVWASGGWAGGAAGYAYIPDRPLGPVALGLTDSLPHYFRVTSRDQTSFVQQGSIESPWQLLTGHFDVGFVVVYLFPLLIFALSYNLLAGEREQGTLRMLLSQPLPAFSLVAGKLLLRALVLFALFALLPAAIIWIARPGACLTDLLLWISLVTLYELFWFVLAFAVNALGKSSAANATILISAWVALVLVIPVVLSVIVTAQRPVSSRSEMMTQLRDAMSELSKRHDRIDAEGSKFDELSLVTARASGETVEAWSKADRAMQRDLEATTRPLLEKFESEIARQQDLVDRYRFVSPAIVTSEALSDVAGTGLVRYRCFKNQVTEFHKRWRAFFAPKIDADAALTEADYAAMPRFRWQDEPRETVAKRVVGPFLWFLLELSVLLAAGLIWLKRYPKV